METNSKKRTVKIWLIEDNNAFRSVIARVLNDIDGFECTACYSTCEAALEALSHQQPDIILLDVELPGMNGIEGIREIKRRSPGTHVIMLTVFDDQEKIFKAIGAGASGYLLKTSTEEKIAEAVREVISGGVAMNQQVARSVWEMFAEMAAPGTDYKLTGREKEILAAMVQGLGNKEIAGQLSMSYHTVDTHLRSIYHKLGVNTRSGAVAKAVKERLV